MSYAFADECLPASLSRKCQQLSMWVRVNEERKSSSSDMNTTYESWIDVGTEGGASFFAVGASTAAYVERHDDAIALFEGLWYG